MQGRLKLIVAASMLAALPLGAPSAIGTSGPLHAAGDTRCPGAEPNTRCGVPAPRWRCPRKGAKVLARSSQSIVYQRFRPNRTYACYPKTRSVRRLNRPGESPEPPYALAGRLVAYTFTTASEGGEYDVIVVRSIVSDRVLHYLAATPEALDEEYLSSIPFLVLKASGSVAWAATPATGALMPEHQILTSVGTTQGRFAGPPTVLDRGPDIEPRSLRLSSDGAKLTWLRGGVVKEALFP